MKENKTGLGVDFDEIASNNLMATPSLMNGPIG